MRLVHSTINTSTPAGKRNTHGNVVAALELSAENGVALWIPPGFAHGFLARTDDAVVLYECTTEHGPGGDGGIHWADPALAIDWPEPPRIVSAKDRDAPTLAAWLADPRSQAFRVG